MQRHQPGDQAWATTLVMFDVAAQNPMCAALSTKSDETAYLSALCTAFVKRMAYAKPFLEVDPEPALKLLADKIALRASADGIQLKVETAPTFSSESIGAVGRPQDAVKVRFDACGSSWKHVSRWKRHLPWTCGRGW